MAVNPASVDSIVAKLRSSYFLDSELAHVVGLGLSALGRQQTFNRGLHDNTIADSNGGTKLAVGDNSAARQSISMQVPQRMKMMKEGAVSTRAQARVELEVRAVPAIVLSVTGEGEDAELEVALVGNQPQLEVDPSTNQLVVGNALANLSQDPDWLDVYGEKRTISLAGLAFQTGDELGPVLPERGQSLLVNLAKQHEKRTIWVNKDRRSFPRVFSSEVTDAASMVNGLCCKDAAGGDGGGGTGPGDT